MQCLTVFSQLKHQLDLFPENIVRKQHMYVHCAPLSALIHVLVMQTCGIWWLCGDSRDSYCDWTAEGDPHMISIDTSTLQGCGWEVGGVVGRCGWEVGD